MKWAAQGRGLPHISFQMSVPASCQLFCHERIFVWLFGFSWPDSNGFPFSRMHGKPVYGFPPKLIFRIEILPRSFDIAVAHQLLNGNDVRTTFQESGRIGMSKLVQRGTGNFRPGRDRF